MKLVVRNEVPPLGDENMEAFFDTMYDVFDACITDISPDGEEILAVWIADMVQQAYMDGYEDAQKNRTD